MFLKNPESANVGTEFLEFGYPPSKKNRFDTYPFRICIKFWRGNRAGGSFMNLGEGRRGLVSMGKMGALGF